MVTASQKIDGLRVVADDDALVAGAGLLLPATTVDRLGLPDLLARRVTAGPAPAYKCLTVLASALAGGDCIDDVDQLRAASTAAVLGHRVAAPSTVGTCLRSFTWGHVRQLDAVGRELLARAARLGAVDLSGQVVVDVDATLVETYGLEKSGARQVMRTGRRGYHPVLAVHAGTGDVLHARLRRGRTNDASGAPSFVAETLARLRAAGAAGPVLLRTDSGFYLRGVVDACARADVRFSIGGRMQRGMRQAIAALGEDAWTPIEYFEDGAAVAELPWTCLGDPRAARGGVDVRLVVRRTPVPPGLRAARGQTDLFQAFDYHPIITDQDTEIDAVNVDRTHREHAEVELAIRDLKYGLGLNHLPSGRFGANAAWLALQTFAHNVARWTARLAHLADTARQTLKTLRSRVLAVPGRLSCHARRTTLHLPAGWPHAPRLLDGLQRLRALPRPD